MSSFDTVNYKSIQKKGIEYPITVWEGKHYMAASQTITIDMPSYPNGIQMWWCRYNKSTGQPYNYEYNQYIYLKNSFEANGRGICVLLLPRLGSEVGLKYIYVNEDSIVGHAQNDSDKATHPVLGTLKNTAWVLVKIVAF